VSRDLEKKFVTCKNCKYGYFDDILHLYTPNAEYSCEIVFVLQEIWMSMIGNFWATRPMTPDMIEYAACDVIVLLPDVYRYQSE